MWLSPEILSRGILFFWWLITCNHLLENEAWLFTYNFCRFNYLTCCLR